MIVVSWHIDQHILHSACYLYTYQYQYIKILLVCPCVCDGCRRGHNEFAGRVQKHHVRFSFHRIFLEIVKSCCAAQLVETLCVAVYAKDAIVGACHRTIDGQEHKISWRAGPEQDKIFHLRVTACREHARQPLSR